METFHSRSTCEAVRTQTDLFSAASKTLLIYAVYVFGMANLEVLASGFQDRDRLQNTSPAKNARMDTPRRGNKQSGDVIRTRTILTMLEGQALGSRNLRFQVSGGEFRVRQTSRVF